MWYKKDKDMFYVVYTLDGTQVSGTIDVRVCLRNRKKCVSEM